MRSPQAAASDSTSWTPRGSPAAPCYPTLDRLEQIGLLKSTWENEAAAHAEGRPARRYFELTAAGATALEAALQKHKMLRPIAFGPGRSTRSEA